MGARALHSNNGHPASAHLWQLKEEWTCRHRGSAIGIPLQFVRCCRPLAPSLPLEELEQTPDGADALFQTHLHVVGGTVVRRDGDHAGAESCIPQIVKAAKSAVGHQAAPRCLGVV